MDKDFVTKEQIEQARSVDLLDYLMRTEPNNLERCGQDEYRLKDHDSLVISNGKFNWFSRGIGGSNAIDYLVKVRGMEFRDAVRELESGIFPARHLANKSISPHKPTSKSKDDGIKFALPEANAHNNNVIEYLKGRGIEENIIKDCINKKMVYQSKKGNCVFVGFDNTQAPKFACERGIGLSELKKDVSGSNKEHSFCLPPQNSHSDKVFVFEGVIDCMSHASIAKIGNLDNWDGHRLSLGGVSSLALNTFLANNPQVTNVYLALDNDKTGNDATRRIIKEVLENASYQHINLLIAPPPIGKDYNDTLMFMQSKLAERNLQSEITSSKKADEQPQMPPLAKKRYASER